MSHNYNLSDIKRAFCSYIWPVVVVYGCGFMSHKMEIDVPGGCRWGEGVCPFFFEGGRATSAKKIQTSWWTRGAVNLLLLWARLLRGPGSCCDLAKGNKVT